MSNKRHSTMPLLDRGGPKPPVHFSSSLVIPKHSILQGTHSITLQSETVLHPYCRLESNLGSILVGRRCVIQERAHVGAPPEDANARPGAVVLGDYVLVEANCVIEAGDTEVGTGSVVQMGSRIGSGAKIGQVPLPPLLSPPSPTDDAGRPDRGLGWLTGARGGAIIHLELYHFSLDRHRTGRDSCRLNDGLLQWLTSY